MRKFLPTFAFYWITSFLASFTHAEDASNCISRSKTTYDQPVYEGFRRLNVRTNVVAISNRNAMINTIGWSAEQKTRLIERLQNSRKPTASNAWERNKAYQAQTMQELEKHLKERQMDDIRKGKKPFPIPLTKEMDEQLVKEGVLRPDGTASNGIIRYNALTNSTQSSAGDSRNPAVSRTPEK